MSSRPETIWTSRRVLNYAHQGGAKEGPSSTLFALHRAVANGAEALELDVHATADGQLVVCHDATVDRTTPASGRIASLTLAQLRELDNAHWWVPGIEATFDADEHEYLLRGRAPGDRQLGIATLREVLERFPDAILNLDIKETAPLVAGYEGALAELLREFDRADRTIVASFHDAATDRFADLAPEFHTSLGTNTTYAFFHHVRDGAPLPPLRPNQAALQVPATFGEITLVDERFVEVAHQHGLAVHAWTIDTEPEMERLVDCGVDGIITNVPSVLERVLVARGVAFEP